MTTEKRGIAKHRHLNRRGVSDPVLVHPDPGPCVPSRSGGPDRSVYVSTGTLGLWFGSYTDYFNPKVTRQRNDGGPFVSPWGAQLTTSDSRNFEGPTVGKNWLRAVRV